MMLTRRGNVLSVTLLLPLPPFSLLSFPSSEGSDSAKGCSIGVGSIIDAASTTTSGLSRGTGAVWVWKSEAMIVVHCIVRRRYCEGTVVAGD